MRKGTNLETGFTALLQGAYGAGAGIVDFIGATEPARAEINAWVRDQTSGRIPELLATGTITQLTKLVLTNAVHLRAPWQTPFDPASTKPGPFSLAADRRVDVPFMGRWDTFVAGRVGDGRRAASVCELPYAGNRLAMVLIVPDAIDGLGAVLAGLDGTSLPGWKAGALRRQDVNLGLPRWTARKPLALGETLASMGMKRAFERDVADFSGMDGTRDLHVSAIVHEGFVDVTETGTEATAATGTIKATGVVPGATEEPLDIRADRPFAWAVVERGSSAILFAGTVVDPR